MHSQKNVSHLIIGKDLDILANGADLSGLAVGQIAAREVGAVTAFTGSAAGKRFQLITKKSDNTILETPVIVYDEIIKKSYADTLPRLEQVTTVGFDGTSGSIDAVDNETYLLSVALSFLKKQFANAEQYRFGTAVTGTGATQTDIADQIISLMAKKSLMEPQQYLTFELLVNDAGAADANIGDLTVTKGVSAFVATGDLTLATLAVGDGIRVGGTTLTSPVYVVTGINTTTKVITVSSPYQGDTGTVLNANVEVITAATMGTADAGIRFTGVYIPVVNSLFFIDQVRFEVQLRSGFGDTTITEGQRATLGIGSYDEVAYKEYFLSGNRGEGNRVAPYPVNKVFEATVGKTYDLLTCVHSNSALNSLDKQYRPQEVIVALEDQSSGNVHASLKTIFGL